MNAMDLELSRLTFEILFKYKKSHTILLITHNTQVISKTDIAYLIDNGKIIKYGCPKDVIQYLDKLYSCSFQQGIKYGNGILN